MKIIGNIIVIIVSLALVAGCIGTVWFMKWSDNYVNNQTVASQLDAYYHIELCGEDPKWYMVNEFKDHVCETLGLD